MRVLLASAFVPFGDSSERIVASGLLEALQERGHEVDVVELPASSRWDAALEQTLALRLLDVGREADVLIALRPPSFVLRHANKRVWMMGHDRATDELSATVWCDLPSTPTGAAVRSAIERSVELYLAEAQRIFVQSPALAARIRDFAGVDAEVLQPPLRRPEPFFWAEPEDYVFAPSAITPQHMAILLDAAGQLASDARIVIGGAVANAAQLAAAGTRIRESGLEDRVTLILHSIGESEHAHLIARSLAVVYLDLPGEGDLGWRSVLQASHASKATITNTDSRGAATLVGDSKTGLVVGSDGRSLAGAIDRLRADPAWANGLGARARETLLERNITWDRVVDCLLS